MTDDLARHIQWARQHWDEPPTRMHRRGVEPDSEIGAPALDEKWRRWLEGIGNYRAAFTTVGIEESNVICGHDDSVLNCEYCGGSDRITVTRGLYRWPFRAAMAKASRKRVPDGWPELDSVVWQIASHSWSVETGAAILSARFPIMGDPDVARQVALAAFRECRKNYYEATEWRRQQVAA